MRDFEKTLIAGWISGEFNDYRDFEVWEFQDYSKLLREIKKFPPRSKEVVEVSKYTISLAKRVGMPVAELAAMAGVSHSESWYYTAYLSIKERSRETIYKNRKMEYEKWAAQLDRLDSQIKNVKGGEKYVSLMDAFCDDFEEAHSRVPIKLGLNGLDKMLGGLNKGELTVVAARPAVGKSAFALQVAEYLATKKVETEFFALEMSKTSLSKRLASKYSGVPFDVLDAPSGKMTHDDYKRVNVAADKIGKLDDHLLVYDNIRTLNAIEREIKDKKPKVVFIDQLSLIRTTGKENSIRERFTNITVNLKRIAMEQGVAIVLLCQLRRNPSQTVPNMSELKESGSIEEDADNIIIIHRLELEEAINKGFSGVSYDNRPIQFIVEKQRNGMTGSIYGNYYGPSFTFTTEV